VGATGPTYADSTSPVINGTNPTWTKYSATNLDVFVASVETTAAVTTIDFDYTNVSASTDWVFTFSVINGREDAAGTVGFATTTNAAFTPALRADTNLAIADMPVADNTAFTPTTRISSPTQWSNETKTITNWINEQK
jgi:hypothetical protein